MYATAAYTSSPLVPPPRGHSSNLPSANSLLLLCPTLMLATPIPIHHAAQLFSPSILMPPFSVLRPSFIALVSGTRVRANRAGRRHRGVDECAVSGQREPVPDPREQRISGSGMHVCARGGQAYDARSTFSTSGERASPLHSVRLHVGQTKSAPVAVSYNVQD